MTTKSRNSRRNERLVGVISDTHGRIHPKALAALRGSDIILHAGDIGSVEILKSLKAIAPVHAIAGNVDVGKLDKKFAATNVVEFASKSFYLIHNLRALDLKPPAAGFDAVIFGHSHKPGFYFEVGVLYFNPGSAGPRRFSLPISVGRIKVRDGELFPEIVLLEE